MPSTTSDLLIVIPARMASYRCPGKALAEVEGKALVQWTYEQARQCSPLVIVATPDREIARYCDDHDMQWRPTRQDHPTGTHRVAEVIAQMRGSVEKVINWQVDEPLITPQEVSVLIDTVGTNIPIATLVSPHLDATLTDSRSLDTVKVVVGQNVDCHWFSRHVAFGTPGWGFHCGIYAFTADALKALGALPTTAISREESLEQLAWLEHGWKIKAVVIPRLHLSINTPSDLQKLKHVLDDRNAS